jgi:hypothetical protein
MLTQALALALAASIYPPAVAAVIALGRGAEVRLRVSIFVLAAWSITYVLGALMLFVLADIGVSGPHNYTPSAALDLALGVALIALAVHLYRRSPKPPGGTSKIERYLQSRRLACVLGITLYALPSPIYVGAVKILSDENFSTSRELVALALIVAVMLWLIELPMLMLLVLPDAAAGLLERINRWFTQNGRRLGVLLCAAAGLYLALRGVVELA